MVAPWSTINSGERVSSVAPLLNNTLDVIQEVTFSSSACVATRFCAGLGERRGRFLDHYFGFLAPAEMREREVQRWCGIRPDRVTQLFTSRLSGKP